METRQDFTREEWLAWRHERIGASDANMIMGRSQYGTRRDLVEQKAAPLCIKSNPWLEKEKGDGEVEAVELFVSKRFKKTDKVTVEHQYLISADVKRLPVPICCSLDALLTIKNKKGEGCVGVEVKCVEKASAGDGLPPQYYWQIYQQCILILLDASLHPAPIGVLYYIEYSKKTKKILKQVEVTACLFDPNCGEILIKEYKAFWDEVLEERKRTSPKEYVAEGTRIRLYELVEKYNAMLPELEAAKAAYDVLDKRSKAIRDEISSLVGDQEHTFEHQGIKVSKVRVQGRIDQDKIPMTVPLHTIRSEDSYMLRVTKSKDKALSDKISFANGKMELR